ncbi:MAG: pyridoxal phosphate-dependent aminotransferase [Pseudomonadota bacterium]
MEGFDVNLVEAVRPAAQRVPVSGIISAVNHGRDKPGLIPLWAGEGDLPTPRFIAEAAQKALADGETFYTHQRGIPPLREALAAYYERQFGRPFDPDSFFVTGSGMQAIAISLQLTVGAGEEILLPTPAWPNAHGAAVALGASPKIVPMREEGAKWSLHVEDLEAATTPATRAIFLNSPANPTGWTASREVLGDVLAFARRHGLWIIADEIYSRFVYDGAPRAPSFLDIAEPDDRIVYVNTFSKNWAMTGWRMGWIHAPVALRQTLENLIQYSTSGTAQFMQRAGVVALNDGEWFVEHMVRRAREGRDVVTTALAGNNRVTYAAPDGAFYAFFRVAGLTSAREASFKLIDEAGVGTAPGTAFGANGEGFVRVCFARSADSLSEAMTRLTRFLAH